MSDKYTHQQYGNRFRVTPSRAYHKYWQGYVEQRVLLPNGKTKIEREYVAPWKQHKISGKKWILLKTVYALLTITSIALFLLALTQDVGSNRCWYVALFGLPAGLLLFLFAVTVSLYIFNPRKMTLWEFTSSTSRLKLVTLISTILLILSAAATGLYTILEPNSSFAREVICLALLLLSASVAFAVNRIESKMAYEDIRNDKEPAEGSYIIK